MSHAYKKAHKLRCINLPGPPPGAPSNILSFLNLSNSSTSIYIYISYSNYYPPHHHHLGIILGHPYLLVIISRPGNGQGVRSHIPSTILQKLGAPRCIWASMQPKMEHDAASNTGSEQLEVEIKLELEGFDRPQGGQEHPCQHEQRHKQANTHVGLPFQGTTQLSFVPSLNSEMLPTPPAAALFGPLETEDLLNFNSQEAWAEFNSSFPTDSFPPVPIDQQAGATIVEEVFGLNNRLASNTDSVFDQSTLPQFQVNVSQLVSILSSFPPKSRHIHTAKHFTARPRNTTESLILFPYHTLLSSSRFCCQHTPPTVAPYCHSLLPVHLCFPCFCFPPPLFSLHLSRVPYTTIQPRSNQYWS